MIFFKNTHMLINTVFHKIINHEQNNNIEFATGTDITI